MRYTPSSDRASRPSEEAKELAGHLAELLNDRSGISLFAALQGLGAWKTEPHESQETHGSVGIWHAMPDGSFARDPELAGSPMWADVDRIPSKTTRYRVVLIGESVARGYYYDPYFNLAQLLEAALGGEDNVEVVDLARIDQTYRGLTKLIREAAILQPNVMVVFAGNNWRPYDDFSAGAFCNLAKRVGQARSMEAANVFLSHRLASRATTMVRLFRETCEHHHILPIVVIPEFNLKDFDDASCAPAPIVTNQDFSAWMEKFQLGRLAASQARFAEVIALAREMIELDHGTSSASYRLLGNALQATGEGDLARDAFDSALDAMQWSPFVPTPRCYKVVRTALKAATNDQGVAGVDVRQVLECDSSGAIANRSWFMDYCHLNAAGLRAVADAIAVKLRACPGVLKVASSVDGSAREHSRPKGTVAAQAHVMAACHNSTLGQSANLMRYHLCAALEEHPPIRQRLLKLRDACFLDVPLRFTTLLNEIAGDEYPLLGRMLKHWDARVSRLALVDAIESVLNSESSISEVEPRTLHDQSPERDLLETRYSIHSVGQWQGKSERLAVYKAQDTDSHFWFPAEGAERFRLVLIYRNLSGQTGSVTVRVNGHLVLHDAITPAWKRCDMLLDPQTIMPGRNAVVINWNLTSHHDEFVKSVIERLEVQRVPELGPVTGEICDLRIAAIPMNHIEPNASASATHSLRL